MKRILLLGMILAICILAFPQGVLAATLDTTSAIVSADVTDYADIIATFHPPAVVPATDPPTYAWILNRGTNPLTDGIWVSVDCSQPWAVTAADADAVHTKGYMDNAGHTKSLGTAFGLKTGDLTGDPLAIVSGDPQPAAVTKYNIAQTVLDNDDTSQAYDITVAFTLSTL